MEIRSNQQLSQNLNPKTSNKPGRGDASFQNITDSFKSTGNTPDELPDLKKAAQVLLKKDDSRTVVDLWDNDQRGIAYSANSERVVMGGYDCDVTAVDPGNGEVKWKSEHKGFVKEGKDGTLYVSGQGKSLFAIDPKTGKDKWSKEFDSEVRIIDIGDDGMIYARDGKNIVALDPASKEIKHKCEVIGDAVIGKDGMVYGGGPDAHKVRAYDLKTGEQKWETDTVGMVRCAPAIGKDGTVYIGEVKTNRLVALDKDTGKEKWHFDAGDGIVISPAVSEDGIVITGTVWPGSTLFGIHPDTGKPVWQYKSRDDFRQGLEFAPDGTLFAPAGCFVNAINPRNGALRWQKKGKSYIHTSPVVGSEGRMYFGTNGAGMHCIKDPAMVEFDLQKEMNGKQTDTEKNLTIEQGKGFVDIGGVKLKVND